MLREMTAQQFDEWIAYYQLEPFGILTDDAQWAHWKAIYLNSRLRKGKKSIKPEKLLMFPDNVKKDAAEIFESDENEEL